MLRNQFLWSFRPLYGLVRAHRVGLQRNRRLTGSGGAGVLKMVATHYYNLDSRLIPGASTAERRFTSPLRGPIVAPRVAISIAA